METVQSTLISDEEIKQDVMQFTRIKFKDAPVVFSRALLQEFFETTYDLKPSNSILTEAIFACRG